VAEITSGNPYADHGNVRTFDVKSNGYVWHKDREDRTIKVLDSEGWQLQIENCLPFLLVNDLIIDIPNGTYHRLIKGLNDLKLEITKNG
jgi:hypothetical protein